MDTPVLIQIGKQGLTDEIVAHIDEIVADEKKSVKVKFLKSALAYGDRHELAEHLSKKLGIKGKLVGNTWTPANNKV